MSSRHKKLPVASLEHIDGLCNQFEQAWRSGSPTSIESLMDQVADSVEQHALLGELLLLEHDYRKQSGEQPPIEEYCQRFPEHVELVRDVLDQGQQATQPVNFEPPSVQQLAGLFPGLEIIELIGSGGMGAVYKARQKGLDRLVALKILPDDISHDVKFALRFTREARALARLNHPNIVSVFEFGNAEGTYYFLMEFVDGSTLRDVISSQELGPQQALAIIPHICEAMQYAHDQGVVHRDIKPENILLDRQGRVKIADFGLSRLLGSDHPEDDLTGTHQVMGTYRYMAPEQLEGAHGVDHRADIYSLGVVFYEMLTGELPLGRFAAPSEKVHIDVRLDEVVLRTLEKEPRRRYQHASQIKSDVESITQAEDRAASPDAKTKGEAAISAAAVGEPKTTTASSSGNLEQQERAARLLLLRRELFDRVKQSLKPLFWGQTIQMLFGIGFIALGVFCWAPNQNVPHRLVSGITLHVYGVLMIISSGITMGRIRKLDCSQPIEDVRHQLDRIRRHYLLTGGLIGFSWWLLWIPTMIALGFDIIMHPGALYISLATGIVGLGISLFFYYRALRKSGPRGDKVRGMMAGESISNAYRNLDEISRSDLT